MGTIGFKGVIEMTKVLIIFHGVVIFINYFCLNFIKVISGVFGMFYFYFCMETMVLSEYHTEEVTDN